MPKAILMNGTGSPEVMQQISLDLPDPKDNEVQITHSAIEVNFLDIKHRRGEIPLRFNPKVLGGAAVGVVAKVGSSVKGFKVGDYVGYATAGGGAYSEARNIDADFIFTVPANIKPEIAACALVKGLTAHYLVRRTFKVKSGYGILVHGANSGVGRLVSQWSNVLGAFVMGTVSSEDKKQIAIDNGCYVVIDYNNEDVAGIVREITQGIGVNVVYDSIGQKVYQASIDSLAKIGLLVMYGSSSGEVKSIDLDTLASKSLFVTRPSLFDYKSDRKELVVSAMELFEAISSKKLKIEDPEVLKLSDARRAHEIIESRSSTKSIVLVP